MKVGDGVFEGRYTFASRFESGTGTNPEELIGAAHAGCFSMALSLILEKAGYKPERIATTARVTVDKAGEGFKITTIDLDTEGLVRGLTRRATGRKRKRQRKAAPCPSLLQAWTSGSPPRGCSRQRPRKDQQSP